MWLENGRWRQWEAFDCVNFDPVHVDFHRFLPYVIFYPGMVKVCFINVYLLFFFIHVCSKIFIKIYIKIGVQLF